MDYPLKHPYLKLYPIRPSTDLIIGSFPIAKFAHEGLRKNILQHEIDFFYGGEKNNFWPIMSQVFDRSLSSAVEIRHLLEEKKISLTDVIVACKSKGNLAADKGLYEITWNKELKQAIQDLQIKRLIFTSSWVEKQFFQEIDPDYRGTYVRLLSPSGAANISIAAREDYKQQKAQNPQLTVNDFRVNFYKKIFL